MVIQWFKFPLLRIHFVPSLYRRTNYPRGSKQKSRLSIAAQNEMTAARARNKTEGEHTPLNQARTQDPFNTRASQLQMNFARSREYAREDHPTFRRNNFPSSPNPRRYIRAPRLNLLYTTQRKNIHTRTIIISQARL